MMSIDRSEICSARGALAVGLTAMGVAGAGLKAASTGFGRAGRVRTTPRRPARVPLSQPPVPGRRASLLDIVVATLPPVASAFPAEAVAASVFG
jgi:hypothetical protein